MGAESRAAGQDVGEASAGGGGPSDGADGVEAGRRDGGRDGGLAEEVWAAVETVEDGAGEVPGRARRRFRAWTEGLLGEGG